MKKIISLLLAIVMLLSVVIAPGIFTFSASAEEPEDAGFCTMSVCRYFGRNRTETAFMIAEAMKAVLRVEEFNSIIIASGYNFADALTGSYLASAENAPILLYHGKNSITDNVNYITENLAADGKVYILGGTAAVPQEMEDALAAFNVERLYGPTRFETNLAILEKVGVTDQEILISTGWNYADALAASATGLPILIVDTNTGKLTDKQAAFLEGLDGNALTILGGTNAVGEEFDALIGAYGDVERVYGKTRENTSVEIAKRYFSDPSLITLAYSRDFPDALCGGALAHAVGAPLLLTNAGYEEIAAAYVEENGIKGGYVMGGSARVSDESVKIIFDITAEGTFPSLTPAKDIAILYTNDVHTYIDGVLSYDVIAGVKAELAKLGYEVLLVDAGDHIQGTAYGSMDKGATIIELMNAAGYDLATLGNHEFDYNMDGTMNIVDWAEFPYTSCNFYHEKDNVKGEAVLAPYVTFEFEGQTVAFVGITTPESFTKSTPAYFQDENGNYIYGISGGENGAALYADVQAAVDAAKAEGATMVIGLGHLGDDPASQPWTSKETIANVSGLDAFIDGHSHSTVKGEEVTGKDGNTVVLTQTGDYFDRIGLMIIDGVTGAITTDFIEYAEVAETGSYEFVSELYTGASWASVEAVAAIKDAWIAEIDTQLGAVIGTANVTLANYDAEGNRLVRSQETNTGDFCADALYYLFDNMGLDVDVAIMNGGGVRNKDITGELSYKTAKEIHTFGNVACLQTITGQQLLDALEWGARTAGTGEECGGFLHVSGITYKIDPNWPSSVVQDDKGVWVSGPSAGYRVHSVMVYNKDTNAYEPLDLEATYNLAGYNYTLRDLGDGFNMFSGAVNVLDYVMEDYMVLANYIQGFEDGVVDAANSPLLVKFSGMLLDYSTVDGSGRIVFEAAE